MGTFNRSIFRGGSLAGYVLFKPEQATSQRSHCPNGGALEEALFEEDFQVRVPGCVVEAEE